MSDKLLLITIGSHFFKVTRISPRTKLVVESFARKYVQRGLVRKPGGKYVSEPIKVFAAATGDREEYRFHINQLNDFYYHLKFNNISENLFSKEILSVDPGKDLDIKLKPNWVAREDQEPIIDYIIEDNYNKSKFVSMQTGFGKTATALFAIQKINKRTIIIIKPMFIEKWVEDLLKTYKISSQDIMVVQGAGSLLALLDLAKDDQLNCKFIIISNKTIQNWLKLYEQHRDGIDILGYPSSPETMFADLGAGIRLIDEAHMDLHLCFKIDLYTNVPKSISLSATFFSNDDFISKMQEIMHPTKTRYAAQPINKYINSYVVYYNFQEPDKIRTTEYGDTRYSHTAFEKSFYKHKHTLMSYFKLIDYVIQIGFMKNERKKKKLLVFASTVEMCTLMKDHFRKLYPKYKVKRYVAEDSYDDNLMASDICFSTLGSSGTAVDIPNLTNVILTVAIDSIQSNVQSLGRLRDLKDGSKMEFHYLTCLDFPKHLEYSYKKKDMLERYAKTFAEVYSRQYV